MVSSSTGKNPAVAPYSGCHVGDRGAIGDGHPREAGTVEFDELVDDTVSPQHLRHPQDEVGCSGTFGERAVESETDDLGQLHHDRLSDHRRFGLDSTHAPPEYAQAVDHRGVRVSADQRVGEESSALVPQHFGEVLRFTWWTIPVAGAPRGSCRMRTGPT